MGLNRNVVFNTSMRGLLSAIAVFMSQGQSVVPKWRVTLHVYVQQSVTGWGKWLPTLASQYSYTVR